MDALKREADLLLAKIDAIASGFSDADVPATRELVQHVVESIYPFIKHDPALRERHDDYMRARFPGYQPANEETVQ